MRYADLPFTLALWLSLLLSRSVIGANINVTVDDSDPSILYQPPEFWSTSSEPEQCTTCLYPTTTLAFNQSYHFGFQDITLDSDDFAHATTNSSTARGGNTHTHNGKNAEGPRGANDHDDDPQTKQKMRRLDSDDPGFVDSPVTAQFKFTGNAVYLFCLEPLGISTSSTMLTTMNLTFVLDNTLSGSFVRIGSSSASGFASNVPVLSLEHLNDGPHVLLMNVLPGSVFVFDYLVYTVDKDMSSPSPTSSTITPTISTNAKNTNHRNIGTFAGAVGGSVGVLVFGPGGAGPAPFIPRYFPRVNPAAPPPYVGPSHNVQETSFFHTSSPPSPVIESNLPPLYRADVDPATSSDPLSYADIPPSTPPPPLSGEVASLEAHWIALPPSPSPPSGETIANSASNSDATETTPPLEADITMRSPTYTHNSITLSSASQQDTGVYTATLDPGIPTTIAPG
ncbi:hypothetical protein GGU11DRAFT_756376 [Lentinula aff. detonsa]|nr:hypothetical protein GGU11DRAFT_756376 [Lentinula aff. detonsa]